MRHLGRLLKKTNLFLILILLLAAFLRLWQLGKLPVGFTPDEASFGYDAYSILKTGKDQWGHAFPIVLESFGDFKSPLYSYLSIPFIAILGLSEFATRLPNALIGIAAVYVLYLLMGEIGRIIKFEDNKIYFLQISSSLLLAVSPWHVMMSRGAFEANLTTFFLPFGIYLFLKGLQKPSYMIFSSIILGLNVFTYHSAKFLTPLVLIILIFVFRKEIWLKRKRYLLPGIVFLTFFALMLYSQVIGGAARISARSITQGALEEGAKAKITAIQNGVNPTLAKIIHNKYQVTAQRFISNYLQYFSIKFLFSQGPAETTYGMIPGIGVLYLFEGILMFGIIPLVILKKESIKTVLLLLTLLLIAPIPAALATGVGYSANRAEGMLPVFQILEGFGLVGLNGFLRGKNKSILAITVVLFAALAGNNLISAWKIYFKDSPNIAASGMLFGRGQAIQFVEDNSDKYNKIIVSRTLSEPQIYIAFYTKYDPKAYQKASLAWQIYQSQNLSFLDQLGKYNLDKFIFKNIDPKTDFGLPKTLLVAKSDDFNQEVKPAYQVDFPNGKPDLYVVDSSKQ